MLPRSILSRLRHTLHRVKSYTRGFAGGVLSLAKGVESLRQDLSRLHEEIKSGSKAIAEADKNVMFVNIGQALTAWARMEEVLVMIAHILMGTKADKVGLVMYSIINFNTWLSIIDELYPLESELMKFKPRWNKLSARIRRIKDVRDRLAHEPAYRGEEDTYPSSLRPSELDVRLKTAKYKPLTGIEINEFSMVVTSITEDLLSLLHDMLDALEPSSRKSLE